MKLTKNQTLFGVMLSLSAPYLVFLIVGYIITKPSEDFQYQDSYFVIFHLTWTIYLVGAIFTFLLYALCVIVVRKIRKK